VTPLRLVLLGDSIAYGQGARRPEDTLGRRLARALTADGFDVDLHVAAVPRAASAQLAAQAHTVEALAPDVAVVVVGANDLTRFVPAPDAARDLGAAVAALRAHGTEVVVVPAPDMSSVPFVPPAFRPVVQAACATLQQHQAVAAAAAGARIAPIGDVIGTAFSDDPTLFSRDRFHPSSEGYARIADALIPHVLAAAVARRDGGAAA
jgi:lysophospholipase L1-like esterase